MASKSLETLLNVSDNCPICQQKLTKPEAFQCLHLCCGDCIKDMEPVSEGGENGYNCPLCRKFTAKDQLKEMHFIPELLEVIDKAKERYPCEKCKEQKPVWRCIDCKEKYCQTCRGHHDGFSMLSSHDWERISERSPPVMDRHVFCLQHPRKPVELHCKDHQKLICIMCNNTEHKQCSAQSIEDALNEAKPVVQENIGKLVSLIKVTERALAGSQAHDKAIQKEYDVLEAEIEGKRKNIAQKLDADYEETKRSLAQVKAKQKKEISDHINDLEMTLQSQKNMVKLGDSTLSIAHNTSLLCAIQSGLGESLNIYLRTNAPVTYADEISAKFEATPPSPDNIVGLITEFPTGKHSMHVPRSLAGLTKLNIKPDSHIKTPFQSTRFITIGDQLWFAGYGTNHIYVCSFEGTIVYTIQLAEVSQCYSIAQLLSRVVVAADNGLYIFSLGHELEKVLDGQFCDITVKGLTIFALDNGNKRVQILSQSPGEKSYTNIQSLSIENYKPYEYNTIQVTKAYIYVCSYSSHTVSQFDHRGNCVATHGSSGNAVGQLQYPLLSGSDANGVLLVADCYNDRFQTLTPDGKWEILEIQGLESYPICAVMTKKKLFVRRNTNFKYLQILSLE